MRLAGYPIRATFQPPAPVFSIAEMIALSFAKLAGASRAVNAAVKERFCHVRVGKGTQLVCKNDALRYEKQNVNKFLRPLAASAGCSGPDTGPGRGRPPPGLLPDRTDSQDW